MRTKGWIIAASALVLVGGGSTAWLARDHTGSVEGLASANGRIEATEIDIATKLPGRIAAVLVDEGDRVRAGQVVARMDTREIEARLEQAKAEVQRARQAKRNALAVVTERESESTFAERELERSRRLLRGGHVSQESADADRMRAETAKAALAVAEAGVAEADAAIRATIAQKAEVETHLEDSILVTPRSGRVLFRLAEAGEVLPAGGKVLTVIDLDDMYMAIFLPEEQAGKVPIRAPARIVLDALPAQPIPAEVSFVAPEAQFTPKQVETADERRKLAFRVKVRVLGTGNPVLNPGMPGMAYIRFDESTQWPETLR